MDVSGDHLVLIIFASMLVISAAAFDVGIVRSIENDTSLLATTDLASSASRSVADAATAAGVDAAKVDTISIATRAAVLSRFATANVPNQRGVTLKGILNFIGGCAVLLAYVWQ